MMDFSESGGILRESEKCNRSGDYQKTRSFWWGYVSQFQGN